MTPKHTTVILPNKEIESLKEQYNKLCREVTRLQEKYDENGYDCSPIIKLQRMESHIDSGYNIYQEQVRQLTAEREEYQRQDIESKINIENLAQDIFNKGFNVGLESSSIKDREFWWEI